MISRRFSLFFLIVNWFSSPILGSEKQSNGSGGVKELVYKIKRYFWEPSRIDTPGLCLDVVHYG